MTLRNIFYQKKLLFFPYNIRLCKSFYVAQLSNLRYYSKNTLFHLRIHKFLADIFVSYNHLFYLFFSIPYFLKKQNTIFFKLTFFDKKITNLFRDYFQTTNNFFFPKFDSCESKIAIYAP